MSMTKKYSRPISRSERMWLLADQLSPPLVNQIILEGTGSFDLALWKTAVEKASAANTGSRLVQRGSLAFSRWIDSRNMPRLLEVDGNKWSGFDPEGAPFLQTPLSPTKGPTCEILLIHGDPLRVAFRTHHAVMDARGTMTWMEDIFRSLRGEPVIGSFSRLTVDELVQTFQKEKRGILPTEHIAPTGKTKGLERGTTWRRLKVNGRFSKLLPQVAVLTAREARRFSDGVVRFAVPVDLRHRDKILRSTGNFSIAIYLNIQPETTFEQVAHDISKQIDEGQDGMLSKTGIWLDIIPLWLMRILGEKAISAQHAASLYSISGILSNLGKLSIEQYTGGGFKANTGFLIPPGIDNLPLFLTLSGFNNVVDILVTLPKILATDGRIEELIENIASGLKSKT